MCRLRMIVGILAVALFPLEALGQYEVEWTAIVDNGADDWGNGVTTDQRGNVIVTGESWTGGSYDYFTVKYDPSGGIVWDDAIHAGAYDIGYDAATDEEGNIAITGYCRMAGYNYNLYNVKYDSSGTVLWTDVIDNSGFDFAGGVATDGDGNVIVVGSFYTADLDCYIAKYEPSGTIVWADTIDIDDDFFMGVATEANGNIVAVGATGHDGGNYCYYIVKYDPTGSILWTDQLDTGGYERANEVAIDDSGNIYVTGYVSTGGSENYFTVKYDSCGELRWTDMIDNGGMDRAWGIATGPSEDGNGVKIVVTGVSEIEGNANYLTVEYSPSGEVVWADTLDNGDTDSGNAVAVDDDGSIIVTGCSVIEGDWDYYTVKYRHRPTSVQDDGIRLASSQGVVSQNFPNPFRSATEIRYTLPVDCHVSAEVYDTLGRRVAVLASEWQKAGGWRLRWDADSCAPGVFFCRLQAGDLVETRRMILLR